ncbi:MAG: hypothetical protein ACK550_05815 [Synechococcaceae cyanobacterium]
MATTWLPDAVVIVSMKRLPSGLMKLVVFWPSGSVAVPVQSSLTLSM